MLRRIHLQHYRNITEASLEADEQLTVICGENGQGKTNLLEAIFLLTGSKSFRAARDMDLVQEGQLTARIEGEVCTEGQEKQLSVQIYGKGAAKRGRYGQVNRVDYGRASALAGLFTAVVFDPGHLRLIQGGPEGRRRFVDAALCQLYPAYFGTLRRFLRALTQKNALLKSYHTTADADSLLDILDGELAQHGTEITKRRADWLAEVGRQAERFYGELSQGREALHIEFIPCCGPGALPELLARTRSADLRAGFSTRGPQREDFSALIDERSARVFGSQGQQRSVALSLKLAEAAHAGGVLGHHPVMLLDDVLSELDAGRQEYLLQRIQGRQCVLTTCDAGVQNRAGGRLVRMEGGVLSEVN